MIQSDRDDAILLALLRACESGDEGTVAQLLDPDITVLTDGGGRVRAPLGPVRGQRRAARLLMQLLASAPRVDAAAQSVNGRDGLVFRLDDRVVGVLGLSAHRDRVLDIWIVLNPDKLRGWNSPDPLHGSHPILPPPSQTAARPGHS